MLIKIASLFLVVMAVLAMFGRLRMPRIGRIRSATKCNACGRPKIGKDPCPCGKEK
ncbi:MAG: hypothetical protein AAFN59_09690 [Pseudomonadota bacterium]